ncbi:MAG: DUF4097 family beta strand repeat-containing protein [Terriglobia bacterium]
MTGQAHKTMMGCSVAVLATAGVLLAAGARQEKTFQTTRDPRISLTNFVGNVSVTGWNKPMVHAVYVVTFTPGVEVDTENMPAKGKARKLRFETHLLNSQARNRNETVDYVLEVPSNSSLEIRNPQGSVRIQGLRGDVWVESVGGPISAIDAAGQLTLRSFGGALEIIRPSGAVEASTVTGDLHFISPLSARIRANTTSGQIYYEGNLAPSGEYVLSSYSGDINIFCPRSSSFELNARSVHGKLDNELRLTPKQHEAFSPRYGNGLFGTHNQGESTLELTSYTGSIHIRPQP